MVLFGVKGRESVLLAEKQMKKMKQLFYTSQMLLTKRIECKKPFRVLVGVCGALSYSKLLLWNMLCTGKVLLFRVSHMMLLEAIEARKCVRVCVPTTVKRCRSP